MVTRAEHGVRSVVRSSARQVTVVGAGVIGLCTALELQRRGHRVTVVAEEVFEPTVSTVAGAVWFPYQVGQADRARVSELAERTRSWLGELARAAPAAGVDLLDFYEIERTVTAEQRPWWAADDVVLAPAPVTGAPLAWHFRAPRAQPSLLLPFLAGQLAHPIERRRVRALADEPGDAVINCTGLAARALAGDSQLQGVFGQVLVTGVGQVPLDVTITDDRDPDSFFYVIPRRDALILGGVARPVDDPDCVQPPPAEAAITRRILDHAARLGLTVGEVQAVRTGLRPVRPSLRLGRDEHDPRILHNYGHGGAGFTLCHGAALAIADELDA